MFKRILIISLIFLCSFSLFSCADEQEEIVFRIQGDYIQWKYIGEESWNNLISVSKLNESGALSGKSAYDIAVSQGFTGTEEEWMQSIHGENGDSVRVGENGNWWIGDSDTGLSVYGQYDTNNFYPVPDFTGKTALQIKNMPEINMFRISYHGNIEDNAIVKEQSIPAGVLATQDTLINLYMSSYTPEDSSQSNSEDNVIYPSEDTPDITVTSSPSVAIKGEYATVSILAKPNVEYRIRVFYSGGSPSQASGLENKTADENGTVSWTWKISKNITAEAAKIKISPADDLQSCVELSIPIE